MVYVYILELEHNKYYVGRTINPNFRLNQHFNSYGTMWTIKYKPIKILELIPDCDDYDEDKYTLKFMKKYGIDNVRGGSFCTLEIDKSNLDTIKKMINGSADNCYECGENGHYASQCNKKVRGIHNDITNYNSNSNFNSNYNYNNKKITKSRSMINEICYRCGRKGHYASNCYAKRMVARHKYKYNYNYNYDSDSDSGSDSDYESY